MYISLTQFKDFKGGLYQPTFTCINGNTTDPWAFKCFLLYWMYNLSTLPTSAICDVQKEHEQAAFKWQKKEFKSPCNMATYDEQ